MALLVNFIIGLVSTGVTAVADAAQEPLAQSTINAVVQQLPGEVGGMIVDFVEGLTGIVPAILALF
jgi:hypothetical protein